MIRRSLATVGAVATIAMLGLTACSSGADAPAASGDFDAKTATSAEDFGGFDALVKAAQEEGELNVIALPENWANYGKIIAAFEDEYGITVNSASPDVSSAEEIQAADNLKGQDTAPDVFDLGTAVALESLDYFAPYEPLLPPAARAELYRFADRDGELLALRSDFTPMLARLLAPHLEGLALPLRLFYRGEVVRCPERGARSEVEQHQIGGELLGRASEGLALEREAALVCARLLALASGGRARLVLGLAGALDELLVAAVGPERAPELARAIARRERGAARGAAHFDGDERGYSARADRARDGVVRALQG